jgi:deoxyribose-phosphate aldolase
MQNTKEIKQASLLAMAAGADFIKTSTGKTERSATLEAAYVMCQAIKEYYEKTGIKIGFKPAGGISTTQEAVEYYTIVRTVLGEEWMSNELFRFGASRLANNLLTSIYGTEVKYF